MGEQRGEEGSEAERRGGGREAGVRGEWKGRKGEARKGRWGRGSVGRGREGREREGKARAEEERGEERERKREGEGGRERGRGEHYGQFIHRQIKKKNNNFGWPTFTHNSNFFRVA